MTEREPTLTQHEASDITRRFASASEERWAAHLRQHERHDAAHAQEHKHESEAIRLREDAIAAAYEAHEKEHKAQEVAVQTAIVSVREMSAVHTAAHDKEHSAHEQRHMDQREAVSKAETSVDKRLDTMNGVYGQMREAQGRFASQDTVIGMQREIDRRLEERDKAVNARFEAMQHAVTNIEKGDVKQEGKQLGMGTVVAIIVGAVAFVGTVLGILVVIANFAAG